MRVFFAIVCIALSPFSFAQDGLISRHAPLCEGQADCRLNLLEQKNKVLGGSCKGRLMEQFDCEVNYQTSLEESPKLKIVCTDKEAKTIIDQTVASESFSYKATATIRGFTSDERLVIDPNEYTFFSNSGLLLFLTRNEAGLSAEMALVVKEDVVGFTDVSCN